MMRNADDTFDSGGVDEELISRPRASVHRASAAPCFRFVLVMSTHSRFYILHAQLPRKPPTGCSIKGRQKGRAFHIHHWERKLGNWNLLEGVSCVRHRSWSLRLFQKALRVEKWTANKNRAWLKLRNPPARNFAPLYIDQETADQQMAALQIISSPIFRNDLTLG